MRELPRDIDGQMVIRPTLTYPIGLGSDEAVVELDYSTGLRNWQDAAAETTIVSVVNQGDGRALVTVRVTRLPSWVSASLCGSGCQYAE